MSERVLRVQAYTFSCLAAISAIAGAATSFGYLSKRLGIQPDKQFDVLARLPELLHAMARFESGQEWPRELFTGYSLVATAYRKGQR